MQKLIKVRRYQKMNGTLVSSHIKQNPQLKRHRRKIIAKESMKMMKIIMPEILPATKPLIEKENTLRQIGEIINSGQKINKCLQEELGSKKKKTTFF